MRDIVGQRGGGRTRPAAVEKTEGLVEPEVGDEAQGGLEITFGLAGKPDDTGMPGRTARRRRILSLNSSEV
jgi:hypothetical protein